MLDFFKKYFSKKNEKTGIKGTVTAVLRDTNGNIKQVQTANLITDDGDIFYAQKSTGATPTNAFANLVLGSGANTPAKNSVYSALTIIANTNKAPSAGYPKANDDDTNNAGRGANIVTWKYVYGASDFAHAAITEGAITITSPISTSKLLNYFKFASPFEKTNSDTLTVYVNHAFSGV